MGADAIGYTLALLTMGASLVAVRSRSLLISVGTSGLWASMMAYILANTTATATFHTIFIVSAIAFIFAMLMLGVGRGMLDKDKEGQSQSVGIVRNITKQFKGSSYEPPSETEGSYEYRDRVRKALNRGKRGRRRR